MGYHRLPVRAHRADIGHLDDADLRAVAPRPHGRGDRGPEQRQQRLYHRRHQPDDPRPPPSARHRPGPARARTPLPDAPSRRTLPVPKARLVRRLRQLPVGHRRQGGRSADPPDDRPGPRVDPGLPLPRRPPREGSPPGQDALLRRCRPGGVRGPRVQGRLTTRAGLRRGSPHRGPQARGRRPRPDERRRSRIFAPRIRRSSGWSSRTRATPGSRSRCSSRRCAGTRSSSGP